MLTPAIHRCQIETLEYLFNDNNTLYRVVCKECQRHWDSSLVPAREGNGKLVGFWGCSYPYPRAQFPMREWWELTNNGIEQVKNPLDLALEEKRREQRRMTEDNPEYQYRMWKQEGGKIAQWVPKVSK